jgi:hypothetical protein
MKELFSLKPGIGACNHVEASLNPLLTKWAGHLLASQQVLVPWSLIRISYVSIIVAKT